MQQYPAVPAERVASRPRRFPNGVPRLHELTAPAIVAVTMLAVSAAWAAYSIVVILQENELLDRIDKRPWSVNLSEVQAADDRTDMVNVVGLVLLALTAAAFVVWFFQAYRNVNPLGRARRHATGWAIGSWFTPVVGLWYPLQITRDITDAVHDEWTPEWQRTRLLTSWWWGLWVAMGFVGVSAASQARDARNVQAALTANAMYLARGVLAIAAAVLAILVVLRITTATRKLAAPSS